MAATQAGSANMEFSIFYDGKNQEDHSMNIQELGESMLALNKTLVAANAVLNGYSEEARVDVKVKSLNDGSFGFVVDVMQYCMENKDVVAMLGLSASTAAGGALALIDWLKGSEINAEQGEEEGTTNLIKGNEKISFSNDVVELAEDPEIRKGLGDLIHNPLSKEGTSRFIVKDHNAKEEIFSVDKDDAASYKTPPRKQLYKEEKKHENQEVVVSFTQANITKKAGWKMTFLNDETELSVRMDDDAFLSRITNKEQAYLLSVPFNVTLRTTKTTRELGKNTQSYTIIKVNHESRKKN